MSYSLDTTQLRELIMTIDTHASSKEHAVQFLNDFVDNYEKIMRKEERDALSEEWDDDEWLEVEEILPSEESKWDRRKEDWETQIYDEWYGIEEILPEGPDHYDPLTEYPCHFYNDEPYITISDALALEAQWDDYDGDIRFAPIINTK